MNDDFKTINVPQSDVNDLMSTLVEWHISNYDYINEGDQVCTMETSKMVFDVDSEYKGYAFLLREVGEEISTLEPLVLIVDSIDDLNKQKDAFLKNIKKEDSESDSRPDKNKATKKAILKAEELNVDLSDINVEGIIKEKDVEDYFKTAKKGSGEGETSGLAEDLIEKKVKFVGNRKTGKDLMLESSRNIPASYVEREIDVTGLVSYVKKSIDEGKGYLTPLAIILYSLGRTLAKHKEFNSFREDDNVVFYRHINVGVVVNVENNLSVPILNNIDQMDPPSIIKKLFEMRKNLMTGKTQVSDFVGGTFTVSAMDHTNVERFVPIIHPGQAGVLAVPKIYEKLKLDSSGAVTRTDCINLGLSFDHTFLNAMQGIEFLDTIGNEICSYIEGS